MLTRLRLADAPDLWADLGFAVEGRTVRIGAVEVELDGNGHGITGWRMAGLPPHVVDLDGIGVERGDVEPASIDPAPSHPNGVTSIDHLVMATPDLQRTLKALSAAGLDLRRVRDAGSDREGRLRQQAFFWLGEVILEVVGPAEPAGTGASTLWGLALTGDLSTAGALLGPRLRPPKPAVQPGRTIATLDRGAGSSVPIVIMSGHRRDGGSQPE